MANLQFKMGLLNDLNNPSKAPITPGTVYITTDEKSMYVDINDSQRIRVGGSIVYCETLAEFQSAAKPPYSTDLIYFIEKETAQSTSRINILARWNGSQWDILNTTQAEFENFRQDYNLLKAVVGDENSGLVKQVNENTANITTLLGVATTVETLQGYIGTPEDSASTNSIYGRLLASENALVKANEDVAELKTTVGDETKGLVYDVNVLEETIGTKEDAATEDTIYGQLNNKVNTSDFNDLSGRVKDLEDDHVSASEFDKLSEDFNLFKNDTNNNFTTINNTIGNKADAITTDTLYGNINNINNKIGNKTDTIDNPQAFNDANLYARTNYNNSKIESIDQDITQLKQDLKDQIDDTIKAANAMNYKGSVATLEELNALFSRNDLSQGDTFVIAGNFSDDDNNYSAGDLIIVQGEENDEGIIVSGLKWDLVETGYQETHEVHLSLNNNIVLLSSDINPDLGKIKIMSDNLNITSDSSKATPELKINMEWGTF